jgi:hypothetical protein
MSKPDLVEIDELIAKAERLHALAIEWAFKIWRRALSGDLASTKAWCDLVADALKRARSAGVA